MTTHNADISDVVARWNGLTKARLWSMSMGEVVNLMDEAVEEIERLQAECERHRRSNLVRAVTDGWGERDDWITECINSGTFDSVPWMVAKVLREQLAQFDGSSDER